MVIQDCSGGIPAPRETFKNKTDGSPLGQWQKSDSSKERLTKPRVDTEEGEENDDEEKANPKKPDKPSFSQVQRVWEATP